jgi:hypothetical protein
VPISFLNSSTRAQLITSASIQTIHNKIAGNCEPTLKSKKVCKSSSDIQTSLSLMHD